MIPCQVCGKSTSSGWVVGFPPAPDSMKLGLCPIHDSEAMREKMVAQWQKMLEARIGAASGSQNFPTLVAEKLVTVTFINGSKLSFFCTECSPTDHDTLRLEEKGGTCTFIPMSQVRGYSVRPVTNRQK